MTKNSTNRIDASAVVEIIHVARLASDHIISVHLFDKSRRHKFVQRTVDCRDTDTAFDCNQLPRREALQFLARVTHQTAVDDDRFAAESPVKNIVRDFEKV